MKGLMAGLPVALSDYIRKLRHEAGLSQEQLAFRAGVTAGVVRRLEQGYVDDPQWSTMRKLARVLNVDLNQLAEAADKPAVKEERVIGRPKKKKG